MRRVLEALTAAVVVGLVIGFIAWRVQADPWTVGPLAGLAMFVTDLIRPRSRSTAGAPAARRRPARRRR